MIMAESYLKKIALTLLKSFSVEIMDAKPGSGLFL